MLGFSGALKEQEYCTKTPEQAPMFCIGRGLSPTDLEGIELS